MHRKEPGELHREHLLWVAHTREWECGVRGRLCFLDYFFVTRSIPRRVYHICNIYVYTYIHTCMSKYVCT